jgi:ABC-type branched-subunit amino acid transport system substrate-binding protein
MHSNPSVWLEAVMDNRFSRCRLDSFQHPVLTRFIKVAVILALGIAGCSEITVVEPTQYRKYEPKPQISKTKPDEPKPSAQSPAPINAKPVTSPDETAKIETPLKPAVPVPSRDARVALLLPLSGPSAPLGKAMLDAAQLSMFELADKSFTLMPIDTGGTAEGARKAAAQAVQHRAQLILGPLHATSVDAVAPIAREGGVPVVAFSNSREVAGNGVFILGFVPRQQVNAVVGYALAEGLSRVAVLAPGDGYGKAVVEAVRVAMEASGGVIVRAMYYDPAASDLTGEVKSFANYNTRHQALLAQRKALEEKGDEVAKRALHRLKRLDTIGALPYDAVLIPEGGERLRALSSLLAYYDVDQPAVRLLGLRSWDLIPNLGSEPGLVGAWFAGSPADERKRFGERFRKAFGRAPPRLATLAYDATALAVVLAQSENGPDFSLTALTDGNGFLGVDGIFRLLPEGVAERAFTIHEVTRNGSTERRSAPQSFTSATN